MHAVHAVLLCCVVIIELHVLLSHIATLHVHRNSICIAILFYISYVHCCCNYSALVAFTYFLTSFSSWSDLYSVCRAHRYRWWYRSRSASLGWRDKSYLWVSS